jgi:hypothetical protein
MSSLSATQQQKRVITMKDAYGNTIHAVVNGWKIVSGEFCFVLTKAGRTEVCRGTLDAAKQLAEQTA